MFIMLNKKFLNKHIERLNKDAMEEMGEEEGKDKLFFSNSVDSYDTIEWDGKREELTMGVSNDLGYFGVRIPMDDDLRMEIVRHMKHKGEKIMELIRLAGED